MGGSTTRLKENKKKIFMGIIISLMIFSVLFFLSNNALGVQDDSDIETTLHCTLETNSLELTGSNLMTLGTHSFWEEPELNIGTMDHDSTRIEVTNLQYPSYNSSLPSYYNKNDGATGNFTVNSSAISQYTLSAPFDTTIQINISYTRNYSYFSQLTEYYDFGSLGGNDDALGVCLVNNYFYVTDYIDHYIYKYDLDFTTIVDTYDLGSATCYGICWDGTYFYVVATTTDQVRKYDSEFNLITTYGLSIELNDNPYGICWDGSYFYVSWALGVPAEYYIYKYDSSFNEITNYDLGFTIRGLTYDGTYYYLSSGSTIRVCNSSFDIIDTHNVGGGGNSDSRGMHWDENGWFYVIDRTDSFLYKYTDGSLFNNTSIFNFSYQILGSDYYETYTPVYDSSASNFSKYSEMGTLVYYFDSSFFSQYDYINDASILQQNLSLILGLQFPNVEINLTIVVSYSTCQWKVPTEVTLTINSEEVIDSTYNSGWVSLSTFPSSLVITATDTVYFRLNITIDFSFTFNLDIISKTYLKKSFELESDHEIDIERMDFDSNLDILKIYLNNIDKGSSNPCTLSPPVSMDTRNIYTLEIILSEEIYLPLSYIYNHLGSGTSNLYMSGISNTLTYSNINGNHAYQITLPTNWHPEYADLTFSNIDYLPDYTANYSNDLSGYGYGNIGYGDEDVSWGARYYQLAQNGSKLGESGGSGYENVYSEYFSALNGYMSHTYGDLDGYNSTYTVNDYLYMQNIFPTELNYEDWISWVHDYNSDYIRSTWDNSGVNFTSVLNEYQDETVPSNSSFTMNNGTHVSNGSLWDIDGDHHNFTSTVGGASGVYPAKFTFTGETGQTSTAISFVEQDDSDASCGAEVIASEGGHSEVMELSDGNGAGEADVRDLFAATKATGAVEFWYRQDTNGETSTILIYDASPSDAIVIYFRYNGKIAYDDGTIHDLMDYSADTWYHLKIEWDCGDDWHLWVDQVSKDGGAGYGYTGSPSAMDGLRFISETAGQYSLFLDAIDYSWATGYSEYRSYTPLSSGDVCINMTAQFTFTKTGFQTNDTVDFIRLYYSQTTNESEQLDFYIWNWDNSKWDIVNSSTTQDVFADNYFVLNSSHYDGSNTVRLYFWCNASVATSFDLYIDKLLIQVNWTKTSGEIYSTITKDIDFSFLDRYDAEADYQKLYNVTIEFLYRYSNYTHYSEFAEFNYDGNTYTLTKDEAWHSATLNFEFDSASTDHFTLIFNITNGLLEFNSNMNFTIFFKCLDTSSYTQLYQFFRYIPPSLGLDWLQTNRGNWVLNFTYSFTASSDLGLYTFYNSFNTSLLNILLYINDEDGWESPVYYTYNTTQSNINFSFNITNFLTGLGKTQFNDFYIEIFLAGNPSNFTLDNLTLFDFDNDFYQVQALWITDTLMISNQEFTVYWKASDRYIDRVEISELYDSNVNTIYNITLLNNTLQSQAWFNNTYGFYELNLTFYDNYSNWERWTLNFTLISSISISTAYKNPIFINEVNTISSYIFTDYSIIRVWYDNSTDYILQYDNSSYPEYEYEFNFTYSSSIETTYNISVRVLGEYNDTFWCNITVLSVIERTTLLDINSLKYSYYQDERLNITFILRDLYNNPLSNENLNYTIEDPTNVFITNSSCITDANGEVNVVINFSISYEIGFYHLNVSYAGTTQYDSVWKLESFQVLPILRSSNSTAINLQMNSHPVVNNQIRMNFTNNFTLTNYNTSTFDMSISFKLNYTTSISYSEDFSYSYTFSATSDILSIQFDNGTLYNYPSNFTDYYFDNSRSTNYAISGNRFRITDLIGDTLYNNNDFSLRFTYLDTSQVERIQLTDTPRTDSNTVQFKEYLTANRTFSYWYFHNSYDISTVSLYHNRTGAAICYSSFTIENSNYYFSKSCYSGDMFTATTTYWIEWDDYVSYEILTKNGTYCEVRVTYQGPFNINNVTIVLDLNADNLYAENWSLNGVQSLYTFKLEIPNINFTTTQQTFTIVGRSSIPYCTFNYFENEDDYDFDEDNYNDDDNWVWYRGYLRFPYYSQAFIIQGRNVSWVLDGIHYAGEDYDITSTGYFECSGFGTGISSAYLHFKAHPIGRVERYVNYRQDYTEVVYRINTILELQNAEFEFYIENDEAYTIRDIFFEGDDVDHDEYRQVKLTKLDGKDHYRLLNLDFERGVNKIHIQYREEKLENNAGQLLLVVMALSFFGICIWRFAVIYKVGKKEDLKRSDLIYLFFFMPNRIKDEKVKRRLKKNKEKGNPLARSWEELEKEAALLKRLKLKKKELKKQKKAEKKVNKKRGKER